MGVFVQKHTHTHTTKDSFKWRVEVGGGSLCLVETFDVRQDKGFKGEYVLNIAETEKKGTIRAGHT